MFSSNSLSGSVHYFKVWTYKNQQCVYEGGPKNNEIFFLNHIFLWTFPKFNHPQNTLLENQYTHPTAFPLFKTVLELLQSDSFQCLCHFFPHLLRILRTLSFKAPLHSWKQGKITSWIFFNVFVGSACWRTPISRLVFKWHVTTFEPRKPFVNPCLAQSFFFKSLSKQCDSFCCCFPQKETKPDANTFF